MNFDNEVEQEEIDALHTLAEENYNQGTNNIISSWEKDAKAAADRLGCGISLISNGSYNHGDSTELSFPKKALTILAARTGGGKTTMMLNVAVSLCLQGKKGLFLTLEEPEFSLAAKTMSIFDSYQKGSHNAKTANDFKFMMKRGATKEWDEYKNYKNKIVKNLVFMDANKHEVSEDAAIPSSLYDPRRIAAFMSEKSHKDLDFVIVDYVQLLNTGEYQAAAYVNIKMVMQSIRFMTGQHNAALIMGAQLNRDAAKLNINDWEPEMLREAADIEQGANMIIAMAQLRDENNTPRLGVRILKNRDGNPFQNGMFEISYPHQFIHPKPLGALPYEE